MDSVINENQLTERNLVLASLLHDSHCFQFNLQTAPAAWKRYAPDTGQRWMNPYALKKNRASSIQPVTDKSMYNMLRYCTASTYFLYTSLLKKKINRPVGMHNINS
jgi:hypothetical protein